MEYLCNVTSLLLKEIVQEFDSINGKTKLKLEEINSNWEKFIQLSVQTTNGCGEEELNKVKNRSNEKTHQICGRYFNVTTIDWYWIELNCIKLNYITFWLTLDFSWHHILVDIIVCLTLLFSWNCVLVDIIFWLTLLFGWH